jgi:hypothetical protein
VGIPSIWENKKGEHFTKKKHFLGQGISFFKMLTLCRGKLQAITCPPTTIKFEIDINNDELLKTISEHNKRKK